MKMHFLLIFLAIGFGQNNASDNNNFSLLQNEKKDDFAMITKTCLNNYEKDIVRLFIEATQEIFPFKEIDVSPALKQRYDIDHPFSLADSVHLVRLELKSAVWVDLVLYYFDSVKMDNAIQFFADSSRESEVALGKEHGAIFSYMNTLIRLSAGCSLSHINWEQISSKFLQKLLDSDLITWKGIICRCGFYCKRL